MIRPMNTRITDWQDKVVWITGASSGIGAALAKQLLAHGAKVAVSARSHQALVNIAGTGTNILAIVCDTTNIVSLQEAAAVISEKFGNIDLLVANAGNHTPMRAYELDAAKAGALIQTNLTGTINTVATALPHLAKHGGIAIVASVAGFSGLPTGLIYGATKAALINFTETLYLDLAPRGLCVYLINPGFVKTPLTDKNPYKMPGLMSAEDAASRIVRGIEQGRFEIHFPRRFTTILKSLRLLPYRWYFWLIHKGTGL